MIATLCAMLGILSQDPQPTPPLPIQGSNLSRTLLPSGAAILVEPMPNAANVSIVLTASARGVQETPETHGRRHLLEHLVARGGSGNLDRKLEAAGWSMVAETGRDVMQFRFSGPPKAIDAAWEAIDDLLKPRPFTAEMIQREVATMKQEQAVRESTDLLSSAAWRATYGDEGLDGFGSLAVMAATTPDQLTETFKAIFAQDQLALSVAGPVTPGAAINAGTRLLGKAPMARKSAWKRRGEGTAGLGNAPDAKGIALAVRVPGFSDPRTTATLAAALAIASELEEAFVTYTPTLQNGLVILGSTEGDAQPFAKVEELSKSGAWLFPRGRTIAEQWVKRQTMTPQASATYHGLIQIQAAGARPESMAENLKYLSQSEFNSALAKFRRGEATVIQGGKS